MSFTAAVLAQGTVLVVIQSMQMSPSISTNCATVGQIVFPGESLESCRSSCVLTKCSIVDSRARDTRLWRRNTIPRLSKEQICTTQERGCVYLLGSDRSVDRIVMDSDSSPTIHAQEMLVWSTFDRTAVERYCAWDYDCFYCVLYVDCIDTGHAIVSFNGRGYVGESCYNADGLLPRDSHCSFCKLFFASCVVLG